MDPEIREAVFEVFDQGVIDIVEGELSRIVQDNLRSAGKTKRPEEVLRTIRYMRDAQELILVDDYNGLRLTLKAIETKEPLIAQVWSHFYENWIAITAVIISLLALFKS